MPTTVSSRAVPGTVRVSPGAVSSARARRLSRTTPSGVAVSSQCPDVIRGRPTSGRPEVPRSSTEARPPCEARVTGAVG